MQLAVVPYIYYISMCSVNVYVLYIIYELTQKLLLHFLL